MNILNEKRRLLPMGSYLNNGGGGSSGPSESKVYNTNIPEYAQPYVETMLGTASQQMFNYDDQGHPTSMKPYQGAFNNPQDYFANFNPMQNTAFQNASDFAQQGYAPQLDTASAMAGKAGLSAMGTTYTPNSFSNQFQAPTAYDKNTFTSDTASAPTLQNYQMGAADQVKTQDYTGQNVQNYMSPYMQNVVDAQQREARRASDISGTQQQAQATQAGAFGGSRDAIMRAERERNLGTQLGDIQATGSQAAFQNAQQQFNQQQQANLQAQQANQGAGLTVGQQNLGANLGTQQLGAGQNLQAQLANQGAGLQAQQLGEQSRQYGAGQGMQAAQLGAQYGLAGQQLGEQSRQYGAGLGLQGLQTGLQAAGQLGQLGQTQYGQQANNINMLNQMGTQQQNRQQGVINQQVQDYATAQQYPMMQLSNMSNLLRGLPMQSTTVQSYQAPPNAMSQLGGMGMTAVGAMNKYGQAKGGTIKEKKNRPAGLAELAIAQLR